MTLGFYATLVFLFNFLFIYILGDSYSFNVIKRSIFFRILRFFIRTSIWLMVMFSTRYILIYFLLPANAEIIAPFVFVQLMIIISLALSFIRRNGALLLRNNFSAIILMVNTLFLSSLLLFPDFVKNSIVLISAVFITTLSMANANLLSRAIKYRFLFDPPTASWQGYSVIVLITTLLIIVFLPISHF